MTVSYNQLDDLLGKAWVTISTHSKMKEEVFGIGFFFPPLHVCIDTKHDS